VQIRASTKTTRKQALELGFQGYGRIGVDASGRFLFTTIKPGVVPGPIRERCKQPHHGRIGIRAGTAAAAGDADLLSGRSGQPPTIMSMNLIEPARRGTLIGPQDGGFGHTRVERHSAGRRGKRFSSIAESGCPPDLTTSGPLKREAADGRLPLVL